jgi:glycosyltransferase involved in cell wall biosynthesis
MVVVVVFYRGGPFAEKLEAAGVRLIELDKGGRWDFLPFLMRLLRHLRQMRPALLHGYLTVANLFAALLKPFLPGTRIIWGIRASNMDLAHYDWLARLTTGVESMLARRPDLIIANSSAGRKIAVAQGCPQQRLIMIENGIDVGHFVYDPLARLRLRSEFGVTEQEIVIGLSARLDPMKGHRDFLRAAGLIVRNNSRVSFLCVGEGRPEYRRGLQELAQQVCPDVRLIWAGMRSDMPELYSAMDIATSTSIFGEGFSNSVAEAMSCSLPCVVTDVGDSAFIVGDTGLVVSPADPETLAAAWRKLLELPTEERVALGNRARQRVVENFSVAKMVDSTESAFFGLLK